MIAFKAARARAPIVLICAGLLVVSVILGAFEYRRLSAARLFTPYADSFRRGDLSEWRFFGGSWTTSDGALDDLSGARGDKAVTGSELWTDYVVESDVRLNAEPADSMWGDAGVIVRVTDASIGVDSYDGYYVGVGSEGSLLLLGRANYTWIRLGTVSLPSAVRRGRWFHLRVQVKGCSFDAEARDMQSGQDTRLTYFDRDCSKLSGAAGVRTFGAPASWKNFQVHRVDP